MEKSKEETEVWTLRGLHRYSKDGHFVEMPADWEFVPSGDPALTRRIKATADDYWVVKQKMGRRSIGIGLCAPKGLATVIAEQLKVERENPAYQKKLEAGKRQREKKQAQYEIEFEAAVLAFLDFHPKWRELAVKFAKVVTKFTIPVGSGTVARTEMIPIEERARVAVIAWMRHNTTDYDNRHISHVAGARREVRRDLAQESLALLKDYRRGADVPATCPLQQALAQREITTE